MRLCNFVPEGGCDGAGISRDGHRGIYRRLCEALLPDVRRGDRAKAAWPEEEVLLGQMPVGISQAEEAEGAVGSEVIGGRS